jgi:hypothetical protein
MGKKKPDRRILWLRPEVHRVLKTQAAKRGETMGELVEKMLGALMASPTKTKTALKKAKTGHSPGCSCTMCQL